MSTVKVKAIEPCDGKNPGDVFSVSERQAQQLIGKGLVKMDGPVSNKMKAAPANKSRPSPAAGKAQPSSALPVARASRQTTAKPSGNGGQQEDLISRGDESLS